MIHLASPRLCPCGIVHRVAPAPDLARRLRPYQALYLSQAAKHLMLDALDETATGGADFGSLHSAYSTTGTNELTGGTPAYARVALVWGPASGGSKGLVATLPTWNVAAGQTVSWVGLWDAVTSGTFLGMMPAGGGPLLSIATLTADVAANTINSEAHGLIANDRVVVWGPSLAAGLTVGTIYYVMSSPTTDTFKLATGASDSGPVDITDDGFGFAQKCVPEAFAGQGTYALSSGSIDLAAVA